MSEIVFHLPVNFVTSWPGILGALWPHATQVDPLENVRYWEVGREENVLACPQAFDYP